MEIEVRWELGDVRDNHPASFFMSNNSAFDNSAVNSLVTAAGAGRLPPQARVDRKQIVFLYRQKDERILLFLYAENSSWQ